MRLPSWSLCQIQRRNAAHLKAMPARSRVAPGATSTLLNGVLSFPLRSLSLSLSLSTLPLTLVLYLVGLGECPAIVDHGLGLFGLQRTGLAQDAMKTSEAALRQQLRQANARVKVTQDAVERADQSRAIAERALNEALERCAPSSVVLALVYLPTRAPRRCLTCVAVNALARRVRRLEDTSGGGHPPSARQTSGHSALYFTALLCAAAVVCAADVPYMAVERKLVVTVLSPSLLLFLTTRAQAAVLFCTCVHCCVVGFLAHLCLKKFV
jgi:hypothetical protein